MNNFTVFRIKRKSKIDYSLEQEYASIYRNPIKDSVASAAGSGRKNQDNF